VIDDNNHAWLDRHLKAPGRGAHLCYQRDCIERAVRRKSLSASFKRPVVLPSLDEFLRTLVEGQLDKISELISLAQRKRAVISGLNILETTRRPLYGLILASDIAPSSSDRLTARFRSMAKSSTESRVESVQAPFLSSEARAWCEREQESNIWCQNLIKSWSSDHLGHLIGRASRVAIGVTEADLNIRLNLEINRISQVLVASSLR
jgi:predicted RNA-binding protein YlxR (DUF448 family)